MKFLIDNRLPITLCYFLREKGVEAVHVIDLKLDAASDKEIWEYATQNSCVIVTKDKILLIWPIGLKAKTILNLCGLELETVEHRLF